MLELMARDHIMVMVVECHSINRVMHEDGMVKVTLFRIPW